MLNKIIHLSLHNRFIVIVMAVVLLGWGGYTASRMEVDVFPDLTAPTVVVMTEANAMPTEDVERLVTFPIETAINGATGVRRVRSNTATGFSVVTVEFDWGVNIYTARQIISEKLAGISSELPTGVSMPVLAPQSSLLGEVMVIGLTSSGTTTLEELRTLADWTIRPRLLSTGGVAQVTVVGGDIKEYQIILNPLLMQQSGIALDEVISSTEAMNADGSGGVLDQYGNEYIIRAMVRTTDVDQIAQTVVKLSQSGTPITLGDIAEVKIASQSPKIGDASIKTVPAVRLSVTKQPGVSTIDLTDKLDATIEDIIKVLPSDIDVTTDIFRQETFINSSIDNIKKALFEGGILVIVILMIFLGNWRTTVISLLAIPLSLLFSMIVLKLMGLSLNTMSLGGMAIAIGSLVDDAIIDVENVFKRLRENNLLAKGDRNDSLTVIYDASVEIRSSIWSATLIIMVTFLPLFFLSGMEGRMLAPLGIAFIVSLFASMVVAITLTPVLGSFLLTKEKMLSKHEKEVWIVRKIKSWYEKALGSALQHKTVVISIAGGLFIGAIGLFFTLGSNFLPPFNEGSMAINVSALPGISLSESKQIATLAERELMAIPEVVTVSRKTGRAELDEHALGTNTSEIDVPFVLSNRSREEVFADVRERLGKINGIAFEIGQPISHRIDLLLSGTRSNIAIKVFGENLNELYKIGNEIKASLGGIEGLVDVNVEQQVERPELQIIPYKNQLSRHGITPAEFTETVEVALKGRSVSEVYEEGKRFDLVLKFDSLSRSSIEGIANITVDGANGKVPLSDIAEIRSFTGANSISRENVSRKLVVSGNVEGSDLATIVNQIKERITENVKLPQGYHVEFGGQIESQQNASRTLLFTSLIAIVIVFLLLFREFKNFSLTSIVMLNLPLAIIGGIFTIFFTSGVVSIPSIIGFISLFGIATRNGILLITHFEQLSYLPIVERIIVGSKDRINPIIMTALTSGLALIPLALGGSLPGNEIQSPMAIVILGGLFTSTLLNLFLIPVVYYLVKSKGEKALNSKIN